MNKANCNESTKYFVIPEDDRINIPTSNLQQPRRTSSEEELITGRSLNLTI